MKSFILYFYILLNLFSCVINPAFAEIILPADIVEGQDSAKSWIKNSHFEKNVNSVSSYADAAGTSPVDGTGGSATITCTRTTSSPISGDGSLLITKDAANRQGQGCSIPFTIDRGDRATMQTIVLPYEVASGTFTAGTDTTNSDLVMWVYDVTNSVLIPVQGTGRFYSNTADYFFGYFQTNSNSTSYRLIFHQALTGTSAYTLKVDNVKIFKSKFSVGTTVTDWVDYTPTGSFTNTTYTGKWRRVGDSIEAFVHAVVNNVAGPPPATLSVNYLPSGLAADSTKLNQSNGVLYGYASILDSGSRTYTGSVVYNSASSVKVIHTETGSNGDVSDSAPFTFTINDSISLHLTVPIQGWASSTQQSDGYNGRFIGARYYNSASSVSSSVSKFTYTTRDYDTTTSYSSGDFTVPSSGWYSVTAGVQYSYSSASGINNNLSIWLDSTQKGEFQSNTQTTSANDTVFVADTIYARAGQVISIRGSSSGTSPAIIASDARNFVSIVKVNAPTTISATEEISMRYTNSAGTAIGTSAAVFPYPTKVYDSHNAYNTSTGIFTCPAVGRYRVNASYCTNGVTITTTNGVDIFVYKNGAAVDRKLLLGTGATNVNYNNTYSTEIDCLAGETLAIYAQSGSAATTAISSAPLNVLAISRIK